MTDELDRDLQAAARENLERMGVAHRSSKERSIPGAGAEQLAELFHATYERLAPEFGYTTRTDTRRFDRGTENGKLMMAVCDEILTWFDRHWHSAADESPPHGVPVLCAWKRGDKWDYRVAKFTGKHWLDVIPETANERYLAPGYWQTLIPPVPAAAPESRDG